MKTSKKESPKSSSQKEVKDLNKKELKDIKGGSAMSNGMRLGNMMHEMVQAINPGTGEQTENLIRDNGGSMTGGIAGSADMSGGMPTR